MGVEIEEEKMEIEETLEKMDENLEYERHETDGESITVYAKSRRSEIECPFCGEISKKVHSVYERKFQDIPIRSKKVKIVLKNRRYFCLNPKCQNTTFAETFEFLPYNGRRSRRLTEEIIRISKDISSVKASELMEKSVADVGKSTICELLKKSKSKKETKHSKPI